MATINQLQSICFTEAAQPYYHYTKIGRHQVKDLSKAQPQSPYNGFVIKFSNLPPLHKRSLVAELRRQNPGVLQKRECYKLRDIIDFNETLRGLPYWKAFETEYNKIIFGE